MPYVYHGNSLRGKMGFCADCAKESLEGIILKTQTEVPLLDRAISLLGKKKPLEEREALDKAMSAIERALEIYKYDFEYCPDRAERFEAARQRAREMLPSLLEAKKQYDSSQVHRVRDHWKTYGKALLAGLSVDGILLYFGNIRFEHIPNQPPLAAGESITTALAALGLVSLFPALILALTDQFVADKHCSPKYRKAAYKLAIGMCEAFDSYRPAQD
jgi:hypothetical protein